MRLLVYIFIMILSLTPWRASALDSCEDAFDTNAPIVVSRSNEDALLRIDKLPESTVRDLRVADERSIRILDKMVIDKKDVNDELTHWLGSLATHHLTVIEHTAVAYILRSGFLDGEESSSIRVRALHILSESWKNLTGNPASEYQDIYSQRLPVSVLITSSREARLLHIASFEGSERDRTTGFLDYAKNYVPQFSDAVAPGIAVLVAAFSTTGAKGIAGALTGYLALSMIEKLTHRFIGHQETNRKIEKMRAGFLKNTLNRFKWFTDFMDGAFIHHTRAHHTSFSGGYTRMFSRPGQKDRLDEYLSRLGSLGRSIVAEQYGMTLGIGSQITFLATLLPVQFALAWATGFDPAFGLTLIVTGLIYPFNSAHFHPHLHKSRARALEEAGPLMRTWLKTRLAESINRRHWLHHRASVNFNLAPLNLGDLFTGSLRDPNIEDVLRMRREHILGAWWGEDFE